MSAPLLDGSLKDSLRPHVADAVREIEHEVRTHVLEYAQAMDNGDYRQILQRTITGTAACFIDSLGQERPDWTRLSALYTDLGAEDAVRGHGLELAQTALRVGSQVTCRRFIKDAYRFGWSHETLASLTDILFSLVATAADAAAQGYARQEGRISANRDHYRARLRDILIATPHPDPELVNRYAGSAGWRPPRSIGVVALSPESRFRPSILPPEILADWDAPVPYLIVPDLEGPAADRNLAQFTAHRIAAVGPSVAVTQGADSLRWAVRAIDLIGDGILPSRQVTYCIDHVSLLAMSAAEDLVAPAAVRHLGSLLQQPPTRATPLLETLTTFLECGGNAAETAKRLRIHSQSVRYRLRRIRELTNTDIDASATSIDLMNIANWQRHQTRGATRQR
ncbi:PucR family transcriptional regulator [Actinomadura oligospora]|uniref:PucR family transcriptional regulator n=1 Tax=Actinomadura oligospora TaxID=111804 RepID=UPI00047BF1D9|nr:helix-turn-helix domain-containing protein [Actinomadura oligospora]